MCIRDRRQQEWSIYTHDVIRLPESPEPINAEVVRRMEARYAEHLPLVEGAVEAVERLAGSFRLALASSSNRPLIDAVLAGSRLAGHFEVTVSSEEVERGKPAPDVFLEAAARLAVAPERCAAVEDSGNGIRAAHAADMRVLAIPNRRYPPPDDALALADVVLDSIDELVPARRRGERQPRGRRPERACLAPPPRRRRSPRRAGQGPRPRGRRR